MRRYCLLIVPAVTLLSGALLVFPAAAQEEGESIEGRYLANVRQVTSGFVKAGEGYFAPDGEHGSGPHDVRLLPSQRAAADVFFQPP